MRVVHVSTVHPPGDVRIFQKECVSLAEAGFDVHLIIPAPKDEVKKGVSIHAIPRHDRRLQRAVFGLWSAFRAAKKVDGALYHLHDPELLPLALVLKWMGKAVIFDSHEDVPAQVLIKDWIPDAVRTRVADTVKAVERFVAKRIAGVVATSTAIAQPFPPEKTILVRNFPARSQVIDVVPAPTRQGPLHVAYIGLVTRERGAFEVVNAMGLLPADIDIRLTMAGKIYPDSLLDELKRLPGWSRVDYVGEVPWTNINEILTTAFCGISICQPVLHYLHILSTKVFDYMAVGLPVISSDFPGWREVVEHYDCTLFIDARNPLELANAIMKLAQNPSLAEAMGRRGNAAIRDDLNWENEARALRDFYARFGVVPG